jgi:hypothetical protein
VVAIDAYMVSIALRARRWRGSSRKGHDGLEAPADGPRAAGSLPNAATIEAFVAGVLPDAPGPAGAPARSDAIEHEVDEVTPPATADGRSIRRQPSLCQRRGSERFGKSRRVLRASAIQRRSSWPNCRASTL